MGDAETYPRLFTVDEANALIGDIRPMVAELLETFGEIRAEIREAADKAGVAIDSADLSKHLESRGIAPRLFKKVRALIERIHTNGCLVNGPESGLIDFPCLYDNEIVFLCWKYGEPRVGHWHRIPDGFAGRRPLLDASEAGVGQVVH